LYSTRSLFPVDINHRISFLVSLPPIMVPSAYSTLYLFMYVSFPLYTVTVFQPPAASCLLTLPQSSTWSEFASSRSEGGYFLPQAVGKQEP
uniref:Uncharacterized protein n=1 Tax=Moschus moschiferus TaxID=68415 RepID=A0A8C6E3Q6_MOSMO